MRRTDVLAHAEDERSAGMSISGVRTAYDDNEVSHVTQITGLHPRPRSPR